MPPEIVPANFPRNPIVEFGGLPVLDFAPSRGSWDLRENAAEELQRLGSPVPPGLMPDEQQDAARLAAALADPGSVAWWLPLVSWADGGFRYAGDHLRQLAEEARSEKITALVVGGTFDHGRVESDAGQPVSEPRPQIFVTPPGGDPYVHDDDVVLSQAGEALVQRAADFPDLRTLFVGEIDDDQIFSCAEVDVAPLLRAFPQLAEFAVCAQLALRFRLSGHTALRRLTCYGHMYPEELEGIAACDLPVLEHLELWAGEDFSDAQDEDEQAAFEALLHSATLPRLCHLGLREFTFIDEILAQLAESPLLPRLHSLDASRSLLTDTGAQTLLNAPAFRGLQRLDLRFPSRILSPEIAAHLTEYFTAAGVQVDVGHPG